MAKNKNYQAELAGYKKQQAKTEQGSDEYKALEKGITRVNALIEKQNALQEASIDNITDFTDSVMSLGAHVGKNNKLFEATNLLAEGLSTTMSSVAHSIQNTALDSAPKFKEEVINTATAMKSMGVVIATNQKKLKKGQITQQQYNEVIKEAYDEMDESLDKAKASMEGLTGETKAAAEETLALLKAQGKVFESRKVAAKKSESLSKFREGAADMISKTGLPGASEVGGILNAVGKAGIWGAVIAAAVAIGKIAYDLGEIGNKLKIEAQFESVLTGIKGQIDIINQRVKLGLTGGENFIAANAALDVKNNVAQMAIEFQSASKTALFGRGLGSLNYGAGQLQMAGISAETIATAMKDVSSLMGSNVSAQFGADIAILAARTGQSSENIASITETFMRLDGVSKETAINMQEGMRAMAEQANINLGALMEDVAEASKDALSYQIKSGPALQKAAAFANSIGVKFTDIANAGRSMVLNYKDSIKAEMSLSAMLGRRVDLSQVRALFAAGRTEDAIKALKAQGLDPSKMNVFQQEQLKNATGGAGLNELQKIFNNNGRMVDGKLGDASKENKSFLTAKQASETTKMMASAVASAMIELEKTSLRIKSDQALQDAMVNNTGGIQTLTNQIKKLDMIKDAALLADATTNGAASQTISEKIGYKPVTGVIAPKNVTVSPKTSQNTSVTTQSITPVITKKNDELITENKNIVEVLKNTELALTSKQLEQAVRDGALLSDSAYTIQLQKEMVAELGLATTLLYDITENTGKAYQSVNIDGKRVMEALASTSRRNFGVARNIMPTTTTK